jgi:putative sterol carrier protein
MPIESVGAFFERLPVAFRPEAAGSLAATFGFDLEGEGGGQWHVSVGGGRCTVQPGPAAAPQVVVRCAAADWLAIVNGRLDPGAAFMTGRLRVKGDVGLALRLKDLFLKG